MILNKWNSALARSASQSDWLCIKGTNEEVHHDTRDHCEGGVAAEIMAFELLTLNLQADENQTEIWDRQKPPRRSAQHHKRHQQLQKP